MSEESGPELGVVCATISVKEGEGIFTIVSICTLNL